MPGPATHILEKLCSDIYKNSRLSYFIIDKSGMITQWGGNLSDLNMAVPLKKTHIADVALFMEGILPLKGESLEFSCIKMDPDICVDAMLFKSDNGYGLIVWDATRKEAYLTQTQQQCNELSLLIEEQKNRIVQGRKTTFWDRGDLSFLEDLFLALNFAVLEMNDQGHFVLMGTPPLWVSQLPESNQLLSGQTCKEDVFSFLGNFIQEAKSRWKKNPGQTFKSGLWIEKDHTDQEFLYEATGVCVQGKKLLIIASDICTPNEKQSLIQKGRNLALQYQNLQRSDFKLKNMHDELEKRVKERTHDLEQANQRLADELIQRKKIEKERKDVAKQLRQSRKMEAIGTLAGGIAHDFNNILSAIMGFTELSILEIDDTSPVKPKLEKILHASDRAKELVRQILTFSHQTDFEKRPLKLKLIVQETLNLLRASLPAFIDIKQDYSSDAYILADPTQIHQVIMNLCTNSWHAMQQNGGTLFVGIKEMDVTTDDLSAMPELTKGRHIVLSIKDTGCGIPDDLIDRIFDPYFTTKDKNKGTGLGLSVVHGIIGNSNGCIRVNSKKDNGSEFKIFLPAFDSPDQIKPPKQSMPFGNNEHILFVDDEIFQTQLAAELLERLGYQATTCNDSTQALDLFLNKKSRFDLVITDMIMPNMTGKILAEKILAAQPDMPIILCSGYSDEIDPETIHKAGITQYLLKPVGMANLAHAIKKALQTNKS
ncbi:MAG: response regulator [Pseudomonadota bacterium]